MISREALLRALDAVEVLSLDVFDTALVRPVAHPTDVFHLLSIECGIADAAAFAAERVRAEAEARAQAWHRSQAVEITLGEIYEQLSFPLPEGVDVATLAAREVMIELRLARAREPVLALYRHARAMGRKVGFVSDMYLDRESIAAMLRAAGYQDWDFLLVSSRSGQTKAHGELYREMLALLDVRPEQVLHLGDNRASDVVKARASGLTAHWLPKCVDRMGESKLGQRFVRVGVAAEAAAPPWSSLWRGLVAVRRDRGGDDFWTGLGYSHVGPLLLAFGLWLRERALADEVSRLYFLARDGHVMHRVHLELAAHGLELPQGGYLYASRRALNVPALTGVGESECDFLVSGSSVLCTRDFLTRVGLDADAHLDAIRAVELEADTLIASGLAYGRLRALFRALERPLLELAERERLLLREYLAAEGVFEQGRLGLVDIGWHGTMQESFSRLLSRFGADPQVTGYYLGTFEASRKRVEAGARHRGFLCELGAPREMYAVIRTSVEVFEWLFCAPHGSVCGFERTADGVVPRFDAMDAERLRHDTADLMQDGALQFVRDFLSAFPRGVAPAVPDPAMAVGLLRDLLERPQPEEARLIGEIPHAEGFGDAARVRPIARPPSGALLPWRWSAAWRGWRETFWRRAYARRLILPGRARP